MQSFQALGAPPPDPVPPAAGGFAPRTPASGSWGLCPSPHWPSAAGGSASRPKNQPPPHCEFLAMRLVPFFDEDFFFGLHLNSGEKSVPFLVKTFFFCSSLNLLTCKNCGRGSSPPMLKIGQNWGKIANYPPQCSTKICSPAYNAVKLV